MKTSDKLIGLLLLLVLGIPVLLAVSFRKSIREGDYTLKNLDNSTVSAGIYKPYKTVKIIAPVPGVLRCYLLPSGPDSLHYSYTKYYGTESPDSVHIYNSGDTLYIQYMSGKRYAQYRDGRQISSKMKYTKVDVSLHLPSFDDIIVNMSSVVIDSLFRPATISLVNLGELHLAESGRRTITRQKITTATEEGVFIPVDSTYSGDFNKLTITTQNGRLFIGGNAWIRDIALNMQGPSFLSIDNDSRIDRIAGYISGRTSIKADVKSMHKLQALIPEE